MHTNKELRVSKDKMKELPYIIACDFDGTLVEDKYPAIGEPNIAVIELVREAQAKGCKVILWSCRDGRILSEAVTYMQCVHSIVFDAVNENIVETKTMFQNDTRKVYANEYWDDKAVIISFENAPETNINTAGWTNVSTLPEVGDLVWIARENRKSPILMTEYRGHGYFKTLEGDGEWHLTIRAHNPMNGVIAWQPVVIPTHPEIPEETSFEETVVCEGCRHEGVKEDEEVCSHCKSSDYACQSLDLSQFGIELNCGNCKFNGSFSSLCRACRNDNYHTLEPVFAHNLAMSLLQQIKDENCERK